MIAHADTGFLVSLYGQGGNSAVATGLIRSKPVFLLTSLGEAEFTNAVQLRVFRKEWTRFEARSVHDLFLQHQAAGVFRIAPLGSEIWQKALVLSRQHSARLGAGTLDLLHVAAALVLGPDVFYTFDKQQRKLPKTQRLRILPR